MRSIRPKFPEIPVQNQMERKFSTSSFRKFRSAFESWPFFPEIWKFGKVLFHLAFHFEFRPVVWKMAESSLNQCSVCFFVGWFAFLYTAFVRGWNVAPPDASIAKSKTIRNDSNNKLNCTHFFVHDRKNWTSIKFCYLENLAVSNWIYFPWSCFSVIYYQLSRNPQHLELLCAFLRSSSSSQRVKNTVPFDAWKFPKCEPEILVEWIALCLAADRKDGKGLQLENIRPKFSRFFSVSRKNCQRDWLRFVPPLRKSFGFLLLTLKDYSVYEKRHLI